MTALDRLHERFASALSPYWRTLLSGAGLIEFTGNSLRLVNAGATVDRYTDAQIDDYQGLPRRGFRWRPPLTLTVRSRFSHAGPPAESRDMLRGTAGFGFWNDPFMMGGLRSPTLPRAIWFFYASPPSDMQLATGVPGFGWKAAMIDALRWPSLVLAPLSPVLVPLMNLPSLRRRCWPPIQRALHVAEAAVPVDMTGWHTYVIRWAVDRARFSVDGEPLLDVACAPHGPLGLVIWLDNQYLVATPGGRFRYGWLAAPGRHWLELDHVSIDAG